MKFDFRAERPLAIDPLRWGYLWIGAGLLLVGLVVFLSLIAVPQAVTPFVLHDKVMHLCAYAAMMGWFAQIFRHDLTRLLLAIGFAALGIGVEVLQALVPARQYEVVDMLANTSGVLLAWALSYTRFGNLLAGFEAWVARSFARV